MQSVTGLADGKLASRQSRSGRSGEAKNTKASGENRLPVVNHAASHFTGWTFS